MAIKKTLNQKTTIEDASRVMSQNEKNIIQESKYQSNLRRNNSAITKPKTQASTNKEPHVVVKGFDVTTGKMRAEDKSTGRIFPVDVLTNGPIGVGQKVLGFPPKPGSNRGAIAGPPKGQEIPPMESRKKKRKKKEEERDKTNIYSIEIFFVTGGGK